MFELYLYFIYIHIFKLHYARIWIKKGCYKVWTVASTRPHSKNENKVRFDHRASWLSLSCLVTAALLRLHIYDRTSRYCPNTSVCSNGHFLFSNGIFVHWLAIGLWKATLYLTLSELVQKSCFILPLKAREILQFGGFSMPGHSEQMIRRRDQNE